MYNKALLRHAAEAHGAGRLPHPSAAAELNNPLCGDRIAIEVELDGEHIVRIGHRVRACVLCQASASILGHAVGGHEIGRIEDILDRLQAALTGGAFAFDAPWADLSVFEPVMPLKSRHGCVTMPFRGLVQAIRQGRIS